MSVPGVLSLMNAEVKQETINNLNSIDVEVKLGNLKTGTILPPVGPGKSKHQRQIE